MSVEDILRGYSLATLKEMAHTIGFDGDIRKKEPLAGVLAKRFVQKESVGRATSKLDALALEVLGRILQAGGVVRTQYLEEGLRLDGLIAPPAKERPGTYSRYREEGLPRLEESRRFEDVIARLTARGLVFSVASARNITTGTLDFRPTDRLLIPDEILQLIPIPPLRLKEIAEDVLSATFEFPYNTIHRDAQLLASYVDSCEVILTKQGVIPKRHWVAIGQSAFVDEDLELLNSEFEMGRPRFLRLALEQCGVLAVERDRLVLGAGAESFFKQPRIERLRQIFQGWLAGNWWNEADRILPVLRRSSRYASSYPVPAVAEARQFIVDLIQLLPKGKWVAFADLVRNARIVRRDFLFPHRQRPSYAYGSSFASDRFDDIYVDYGIFDNEKGWREIETRFIASIIAESLFWLGAVAVSFKDEDLLAFKVNDVGDALLRGDSYVEEHPPSRKIILQPNFQIFAFEPVDDDLLITLGVFAERVNADSALEYRLSRQSVYRAQQKGLSVPDILAFLENVAEGPLPQNVYRTLLEWGEQHERIVFRRGVTVCQVASAELMESLLVDPDLMKYFGRRISETAAFVVQNKNSPAELPDRLLAKGHLPVLTPVDDGAAAVKVVTVERDGRIQITQKVPNIYVVRRVSWFTESKNGERRITRGSIRAALKYGLSLDAIVQILQSLHGSDVSPELITRIKAWGDFFGRVSLDEVTLLKVANETALKELLQNPVTGRLLTPFVPSEGLATVKKEDAAALSAALRDLGIDIGHLDKVSS